MSMCMHDATTSSTRVLLYTSRALGGASGAGLARVGQKMKISPARLRSSRRDGELEGTSTYGSPAKAMTHT